MSNAIISFNFEGVQVQAVNRNGDAWFVGMEVTAALGYADTDQAIRNHCKAAENLKPVELTGLGISAKSPRGLKLIPERDLYRLVMNSQKPTAIAFEEKVVGEILPSIRKTGGYIAAAKEETPEELALRAVTVLQAALERQREESRLEIERQKALIDETAPKAAALDRISASGGEFGLTETAKMIQVKPGKFFDWLDQNRCRYSKGKAKMAYQERIDAGYLKNRANPYIDANGEPQVGNTIKVTAKGLAWFARMVPDAELDPVYAHLAENEAKTGLRNLAEKVGKPPFAKSPEPVS
ncbi:phage antitermination protein [Gluconobacter cerevisiae]|uniref:Phage antitermination protein n=1 Tax=Gluconobacter cerevisiae TaxID=1379734 RepID=A0ABR9YFA7_9PROT|nr:phage antirepressor KilAC domain-containing protein [Gluconobacter cerevisiae]MBF0877271.1 phage antitermination protein [Gluconobacter cerevisiae]